MDSESASNWKRTLEIQGFGRSAEHVPSEVESRSAEADHCKDGWKDARQIKWWKKKKNEINHHNSNGGRSSGHQGNNERGWRGGIGSGRGGRSGICSNNSEHLTTLECLNCGKKGHYFTDCSAPRNNDNEHSNMVSKADFKNLCQSSLKDMLTKKEKQAKKKENTDVGYKPLDMNVFEKLMEGKYT
jgi:hypothetical protein